MTGREHATFAAFRREFDRAEKVARFMFFLSNRRKSFAKTFVKVWIPFTASPKGMRSKHQKYE